MSFSYLGRWNLLSFLVGVSTFMILVIWTREI